MHARPELLLHHTRPGPRVSIILIDWGVRESFHSVHYLNRQTAPRDAYELIWLEFYDHKPRGLREMATRGPSGGPALDKWVVLGFPHDCIFHKHRLYNVGLLLARGDICVICDSDAMFAPTFVDSILAAFAQAPRAVVHIDEVRNVSPEYYPFNYPTIEDVLGAGCINWHGTTTLGLDNSHDILHHANYGACMAARRKDLLAVGGADEHLDYLGYVCGPYELTFRLASYYGRPERWLPGEYVYHTWHPNQGAGNTDRHGPHDGYFMSLLALDARASFRTAPCLANPWTARAWWRRPRDPGRLLRLIRERPEPSWRAGAARAPEDRVYWIERDHCGFDVFHYAGRWYGLRTGGPPLSPAPLRRGAYRELWQAESHGELRGRLPVDPRHHERLASAPAAARLWRKLRAQPLRRLPRRLVNGAWRLTTA
jgi:hypothetical protein